MDLGQEIRRLREDKDWTQTQLAYHADTAPSSISLIESGRREPHVGTLRKLAQALDVSIVDLLESESSKKAPAQQPNLGAAARPEAFQHALAVLYREIARKGRAIEQKMKAGQLQDLTELVEFGQASALLASLRGKRDIWGREVDDLAEATDDLEIVDNEIQAVLEQGISHDLDESQRAQLLVFQQRHAGIPNPFDAKSQDANAS